MTDPIEHLGWDSTHPTEWRLGGSCAECDAYISEKRAATANVAPYLNVKRLQADNAGHYTQNEIAQSIFKGARENDIDIQRAR